LFDTEQIELTFFVRAGDSRTAHVLGTESVGRSYIFLNGFSKTLTDLQADFPAILYECIDELDSTIRELATRRLEALGILRLSEAA
jgi:hypothetical protein